MEKHCYRCNKELDALLPFQCKYCKNYFCEIHRLPEQHECPNVKTSWDTWKRSQRKIQEIPAERHSPQYSRSKVTPKGESIKIKTETSPKQKKIKSKDNEKEKGSLFKKCSFCSNESLDLVQCEYCKEWFCKDHIEPKTPREIEYLTTPEGHACKSYTEEKRPTIEHSKKENFMQRRYQLCGGKIRNKHRTLPKLHLSIPALIFIISFMCFIILRLINIQLNSNELMLIYLSALCIAEVSGLFWLLFKLNRIGVHTHLRLWGLKILSVLLVLIGSFIFLILIFGSMMYQPLFQVGDINVSLMTTLALLIPLMGFGGIGAYLNFKFRRESGIIVYKG